MQIFYGEVCVQLKSVTKSTVTFSIGPKGRRTEKTVGLQALRCANGRTLDQCRIETRPDVPAGAQKRYREQPQARAGRAG